MQHEGLNVAMGTITLNSRLFMPSFFPYYVLLKKKKKCTERSWTKNIGQNCSQRYTGVTSIGGENNKPKIMSALNRKQNYNWQNMVSLNTTKWIWQLDPILSHIYLSQILFICPKFYWTSTWAGSFVCQSVATGKQIAIKRNRKNGSILLHGDSILAAEDGKRLIFVYMSGVFLNSFFLSQNIFIPKLFCSVSLLQSTM